jgi:hypothetical protein
MRRNELTAEAVINKIKEMHGNVTSVSRAFKMSRQTLYKYINDHPTVQAALDESRETMIDNVESALYTKALKGDTASMIFFLKTQGKKRGYVERSEITGKDGGAIVVDWDNATDDNSG